MTIERKQSVTQLLGELPWTFTTSSFNNNKYTMTKSQRITRTIGDFIRYTEWRAVFIIATIGFILGFAFNRVLQGDSAQTKPIEKGNIKPAATRQTALQGNILANSLWPELLPEQQSEFTTTKNCEWVVTDADEEDLFNLLALENWMLEQDDSWIERPENSGYTTTWLEKKDYTISTLWWNDGNLHKPMLSISASRQYMKKLGPWLRANHVPYSIVESMDEGEKIIEIYSGFPGIMPE